jgi:hypothetical protein
MERRNNNYRFSCVFVGQKPAVLPVVQGPLGPTSGLTPNWESGSFDAAPGNRYFVTGNASVTLASAVAEPNGIMEFFIGESYTATFDTIDGQTVLGRGSGLLVLTGSYLYMVSDGTNWQGFIAYQ